MRGLLSPIGERPRGLARATGFVLLAILYCGFVATFVTFLLSFALLEVPGLVADSTWRLVVGTLWLVATSLMIPFLLLINVSRLPRLTWATWWVLLVDAVLRLMATVAAAAGAPKSIYTYGMYSFFAYDFRQARWSTALASVVVAACTLAVLMWFSRREHRDEATPLVDLHLDASAS